MSTTTKVNPSLRRQRSMTEEAAQAAVDQACRRLRLPTMRAVMEEAVKVAEREQLSYAGFLAELLLAECDDRDRRSVERRVRGAGFPRQKWLGDFDFDANPNVNPAVIHTLAQADWIRRGDPLCLIGDSGTGKSHCETSRRRPSHGRPPVPGGCAARLTLVRRRCGGAIRHIGSVVDVTRTAGRLHFPSRRDSQLLPAMPGLRGHRSDCCQSRCR